VSAPNAPPDVTVVVVVVGRVLGIATASRFANSSSNQIRPCESTFRPS
jgi:hypothetical protein